MARPNRSLGPSGAVDGAHATVQTAVTSMRYGAFDYITKPFWHRPGASRQRAFGEWRDGCRSKPESTGSPTSC